MTVVDQQQIAALDRGERLPQPRFRRQAHLRPEALGERYVQTVETLGQCRRGRLARHLDEAALRCGVHEQLPQLSALLCNAVQWHGVEQFVRKYDPAPAQRRDAPGAYPAGREVRRRFAQVDRRVRQRVRETALERSCMRGRVQRERTVSGACLDDVEGRRAAERTPHREQLPRGECSESRVRERCGVEVAERAEGASRRVVAAVRPVQRDFHELCERDRAAQRDASAGFGVSAGGSEQTCHAP